MELREEACLLAVTCCPQTRESPTATVDPASFTASPRPLRAPFPPQQDSPQAESVSPTCSDRLSPLRTTCAALASHLWSQRLSPALPAVACLPLLLAVWLRVLTVCGLESVPSASHHLSPTCPLPRIHASSPAPPALCPLLFPLCSW